MSQEPRGRVTIYIRSEIGEALKRAEKELGVPWQVVMRIAVVRYLELLGCMDTRMAKDIIEELKWRYPPLDVVM